MALVLPRFVTFNGDNGRFICRRNTEDLHLDGVDSDIVTRGAVHEVFDEGGNIVTIKSVSNQKFWWHHQSEWTSSQINASSSNRPTANNRDGRFLLTRISGDTVALTSMANNQYCKRFTRLGTNKFRAIDASISQFARLIVAEPVIARELQSIEYHINRIVYLERRPIVLSRVTSRNNSETLTQDVELTVSYNTSQTTTWSNSVALGISVGMTFTAGVPLVASTQIEISSSVTNTTEWGKSTSRDTEVTSTITVREVPPQTTVTITASGQEGVVEVPFSYVQRDTWTGGHIQTESRVDGMFRGINAFDIHFDAEDTTTGSHYRVFTQ